MCGSEITPNIDIDGSTSRVRNVREVDAQADQLPRPVWGAPVSNVLELAHVLSPARALIVGLVREALVAVVRIIHGGTTRREHGIEREAAGDHGPPDEQFESTAVVVRGPASSKKRAG